MNSSSVDKISCFVIPLYNSGEFPYCSAAAISPSAMSRWSCYQLCFGASKNCREDEKFVLFVKNAKTFFETAGAGNPLDVFPW
jgi:hypothetical protein